MQIFAQQIRFAQSFLVVDGIPERDSWYQKICGASNRPRSKHTHHQHSTPQVFWGPAPVPPKVYQTWAAIRGEGRDGSEYEDPEGIDEGGAHDSWVSQFSKRFATDPVNISGTGRDGSSTDTEGGDEGDGGSFATGSTDISIDTSTIAGEGRDPSTVSTEGGDEGDGGSFATGEGSQKEGLLLLPVRAEMMILQTQKVETLWRIQ